MTPDPGDARYFLDLLRRQLTTVYPAEALTSEGLRIYSTLDRRAQRLAATGAARRAGGDLEERFPHLKSGGPQARAPGLPGRAAPADG